ncbi:hypothetical protein SLEP1_g29494 [Rubroshorea leprosula]|uniref:Uncharacterized protein n=1 Tax=Rubroshorea leprosula TaxID=152421 RepID=A0AAV5JX43_9ROSI|nr:hypothetical protein SLEP1_g29494 [Rubroshorea leprosula]
MDRLPHFLCIIMLAVQVLSLVAKSQALEGSSGSMAPRAWPEAQPPNGVIAESPRSRLMGKHRYSDAGGDFILGGFVMVMVVVVACYIRVTRKNPEAAKA